MTPDMFKPPAWMKFIGASAPCHETGTAIIPRLMNC